MDRLITLLCVTHTPSLPIRTFALLCMETAQDFLTNVAMHPYKWIAAARKIGSLFLVGGYGQGMCIEHATLTMVLALLFVSDRALIGQIERCNRHFDGRKFNAQSYLEQSLCISLRPFGHRLKAHRTYCISPRIEGRHRHLEGRRCNALKSDSRHLVLRVFTSINDAV